MKICHHCQKKFSDEFSFCPTCGKPLEEEQKVIFCPYCGEAIAGEKICPKCHHSLDLNPNPSTNSSQTKVVSNKQPFQISYSTISAALGLLIAFLSLAFIFIPFFKVSLLGDTISDSEGIIYFLTDIFELKDLGLKIPSYISFGFSIITLLALIATFILTLIYFIKSFSSPRYTRHTLSFATLSVFTFLAFYFFQKTCFWGFLASLSTAGIIYIILCILLLIMAIILYAYVNVQKIHWKTYTTHLIIGCCGFLFILLSFVFLSKEPYKISIESEIHDRVYNVISTIYLEDKTFGTILYSILPLYTILGFGMAFYFIQLLFEFQSPAKSVKNVGNIIAGIFIFFSIGQFVLIILSSNNLYKFLIEDLNQTDYSMELTFISSLNYIYSILSLVFNILVCCAWYVWMILEKKLGKPKQQAIQNQTA